MHLKTAAAAQAAGMTLGTLQRYLARSIVKMMPCDIPSNGQGTARGFSRRRVLQLAITAEITKLGISPTRAAKAAYVFTDQPGQRRPSYCAHLGSTYLLGLAGGETKIVDVPPDRTIADALRNRPAAWLVNLTSIVNNVDKLLKHEAI